MSGKARVVRIQKLTVKSSGATFAIVMAIFLITPIRRVLTAQRSTFFCPSCQPDSQGRGFVDWRKVPPKG